MSAIPRDAETILRTFRRIAVVGISDRPERPSHYVSRYLIDVGYDVVPVNPVLARVHERPCYPDLGAIPAPVEVVDVFPPLGTGAAGRRRGDRDLREAV
jgi:predicted CoA-binding protein